MTVTKLSVIKIGGSTINDWSESLNQINEIINMGNSLVIVHGGGKTVSQWGSKLGIRPEFVKGLRKTDSNTLEVAISVLSGLVNSKLVSFLNSKKINSVGISGISAGLTGLISAQIVINFSINLNNERNILTIVDGKKLSIENIIVKSKHECDLKLI